MKTLTSLILFVAVLFTSSDSICSPLSPATASADFRTNVYGYEADNSRFIVDGVLIQFGDTYNSGLDGKDARKMSNFSENCGMLRQNTVLVIERRHTIELTDTIFYKIWGMRQTTYLLEFVATSLAQPGLEAVLQDDYLKTETLVDINGTSSKNVTFNSDPASTNPNRFRIVFRNIALGALPLKFSNFTAISKKQMVEIGWETQQELEIVNYSVEKSSDSKSFSEVYRMPASNRYSNNYKWIDVNGATGIHYYRIKSSNKSGEISYTKILRVSTEGDNPQLKVISGSFGRGKIQLSFPMQNPGTYLLVLYNLQGQAVQKHKIQHDRNGVEECPVAPGVLKGLYKLSVTKPDQTRETLNVVL